MKLEGTQQMQFHEAPEQDRVYKTENARLKFAASRRSMKLPRFRLISCLLATPVGRANTNNKEISSGRRISMVSKGSVTVRKKNGQSFLYRFLEKTLI